MYIEIKNPLIHGTDEAIVASQESLEDENTKYTLLARDYILKMYNKSEDYSIVLVRRPNEEQFNDIAFNFYYGSLNKEQNSFIKGSIHIGYDEELVSIRRTDISHTQIPIIMKNINDIFSQPSTINPYKEPNYTGTPIPYQDSKTTDPLPWKDTCTGDPIPDPYIIITNNENDNQSPINTSTTIKHINIAKSLEVKSEDSINVNNNIVSVFDNDASVNDTTLDLDQRKKYQSQFMQTMNKKHKEI